MFKLDLSPTYSLPVTVQVRGASGEIKPETFRAEFLRMGPEEFDAYQQSMREQNLTDADIATHVLRGWHDMVDGTGAAVPFDAAHLDALLRGVTGAAAALARTWIESVLEEVRKNLLPPPATGPAATVAPTLIE
jgi:hypothetical protein